MNGRIADTSQLIAFLECFGIGYGSRVQRGVRRTVYRIIYFIYDVHIGPVKLGAVPLRCGGFESIFCAKAFHREILTEAVGIGIPVAENKLFSQRIIEYCIGYGQSSYQVHPVGTAIKFPFALSG